MKKGRKIKPFFTRILENFCLKNSDVILTQNEYNLELAKIKNKNVLLLDNGVDLAKLNAKKDVSDSERKRILKKYDIPDKRFLVGFVANITKLMDIECMIEASGNMSPDSALDRICFAFQFVDLLPIFLKSRTVFSNVALNGLLKCPCAFFDDFGMFNELLKR